MLYESHLLSAVHVYTHTCTHTHAYKRICAPSQAHTSIYTDLHANAFTQTRRASPEPPSSFPKTQALTTAPEVVPCLRQSSGPVPLRTPSALPSHDAEEQPPDDHLRPPTTWVCYLPSPRPSPLQVARAIKKRSDHHLYGVILWLATPHLSFFPASLALCCVR